MVAVSFSFVTLLALAISVAFALVKSFALPFVLSFVLAFASLGHVYVHCCWSSGKVCAHT